MIILKNKYLITDYLIPPSSLYFYINAFHDIIGDIKHFHCLIR